MAVRSVLEVEVSDDSFQKFKSSFEKYQSAVKELPGQWSKVGTAAEGASNNFADMVAALLAGNEQLLRVNRQTTAFGQAIHGADGGLQKIVQHTHRIGQNVATTTAHLLKWTGIFSAVGGLLGAGSLFGLDRLAGSAAAGRRSSLGLGMRFGEQRAFETDFSRFVDPGRFLGAVNTGLTDVTSQERVGLSALGISQQEVASGDTAKVGIDVLRGLKRVVDATQTQMLGPTLQARGLSGLISIEDARRLKATTPQEFQQQLEAYQRDRTSFQLPPDVLKKWADLSTQLSRAGLQVQTVLIDDLSRLAPSLGHLSEGFTKAVDAFLRAPVVGSAIDGLASGFSALAVELSSNEFNSNVREFTKDIGLLATVLGSAIPDVTSDFADIGRVFKIIGDLAKGDFGAAWSDAGKLSDFRSYTPAPAPAAAGYAGGFAGWWGGRPDIAGGWGVGSPNSWFHPGTTVPLRKAAGDYIAHGGEAGSVIDNAKKGYYVRPDTGTAIPVPQGGASDWGAVGKWWNAKPMPDQQMQKLQPVVKQLEKLGWSPAAAEGVAANVWRESKANPAAIGDSGSAYGLGQWHPDRQADFRAAFGRDIKGSSLDQQVAFIDYELRHKESLAGHMLSTAKAAAEAAAIISRYYERPADKRGEAHTRAEIAARISAADQGNRRQPPPSSTRIVVENRTGGSAVISAAALAGPG